jgi:hypothetical protein
MEDYIQRYDRTVYAGKPSRQPNDRKMKAEKRRGDRKENREGSRKESVWR